MNDQDRINHFPASPLVSVTHVIEGELSLVPANCDLDDARRAAPLPRQSIMPRQDCPVTSWSPGSLAAVTVGFFPDAWAKLGGSASDSLVSESLANAFRSFSDTEDFDTCWAAFCASIATDWQAARTTERLADWSGSIRLADWSRSLLSRAALAGPGRSIRALDRRLKRWSNQTRRSLKFYADFDNLHRLSTRAPDVSLAALASDAGYSDQSHMGRAVRRATGFSPAHLNQLIETEEAFWCYRLLGERF